MVTPTLIHEAFKAHGFDSFDDVPASCAMGARDMANANLRWVVEGTEPPANANAIEWEKAQGAVAEYLQAYGLI